MAELPGADSPLVPVFVALTGAYLAWFATHYWRDTVTIYPSDPIKALLQGRPLPAPQRGASAVAMLTAAESTMASATTSGSGSGGGAGAPAGPGETAWVHAFLAAIGAPLTAANVTSVTAWVHHEQSSWPPSTKNNPLNTTQTMPGSTPLPGNTAGVQEYPTAAVGLAATKITIESGSYNDLLLALRGGRGLCGRTWSGLATWSDLAHGGYNSVC